MVLAFSEAVLITIYTVLGAVIVAIVTAVPAYVAAKQGQKTREIMGDPNGYGTLAEATSKLIKKVDTIHEQVYRLDGKVEGNTTQLTVLGRHADVVDSRHTRFEERQDRLTERVDHLFEKVVQSVKH